MLATPVDASAFRWELCRRVCSNVGLMDNIIARAEAENLENEQFQLAKKCFLNNANDKM